MTIALIHQAFPENSIEFKQLVDTAVTQSLNEDVGSGDLTAELIDANHQSSATIISREHAVICGIPWVDSCFKQINPEIQIDWQIAEGDTVEPNQVLCHIRGNTRAMLTAERTALNFLQTLSATATVTRRFVDAIQGLKAHIHDTRKTIPGLRMAQKYAVVVGGGHNQRLALYDGILIKENHIATAGSIQAALDKAYQLNKTDSIQIEVETIEQFKEALAAGAKSVLLDNFSHAQMREAVTLNQGQALLEASGNVNMETVRPIAETGVDRISIGGLTKHIKAVDLSMRINMDKQ